MKISNEKKYNSISREIFARLCWANPKCVCVKKSLSFSCVCYNRVGANGFRKFFFSLQLLREYYFIFDIESMNFFPFSWNRMSEFWIFTNFQEKIITQNTLFPIFFSFLLVDFTFYVVTSPALTLTILWQWGSHFASLFRCYSLVFFFLHASWVNRHSCYYESLRQ